MFILDECNNFLVSLYRQPLPEGVILEAGGGSFAHFSLPDDNISIALDIEFGQLQKNNDVNFCVNGDLHMLPIAAESCAMSICFNVIEHLDEPERVLAQLIESLAPGGILLIGCPNRNSIKGFITRLTPLWFHRAYYKYIVGKKDRGDGHFDVFPTPFRPIVSAGQLPLWLEDKGMDIVFFKKYDGAKAYGLVNGGFKQRLAAIPYYFINMMIKILSLGKFNGTDSDLLLICVKRRLKRET